ncbi:hypothetical protein ACE1ET_09410 [Saccharicrinis sp. FJH62]|uniref:hypothetical protein n=1 Tax=Saccharicrinis sp. FJH62 TaxID=3344657 RepID=UPI0035D45C99
MLDTGINMEIVLLILGIILFLTVGYVKYKFIYDKIRISKLTGDDLKFDAIRPIYKKLKRGELPEVKQIMRKAKDLEYRILTYDVLNTFDKKDVFPDELLSIEKSSEGYLANWLNMQYEFGDIPDEIVYEKTIRLNNATTVLVFKFRKYSYKWMIAYVGYKSSKLYPYLKPDFIGSDFISEMVSNQELDKYMWKE